MKKIYEEYFKVILKKSKNSKNTMIQIPKNFNHYSL